MTASRPSRASFTATAATAGKTASAWLVNPATMPPGVGSPVSSQAVCETFDHVHDAWLASCSVRLVEAGSGLG
jgi:hypothetical protein